MLKKITYGVLIVVFLCFSMVSRSWSHEDPEHPLEHRIWHLEQTVEKLTDRLNQQNQQEKKAFEANSAHEVTSTHEPVKIKLNGGVKLTASRKKREFKIGGLVAANTEIFRGAYTSDQQNSEIPPNNLGDTAHNSELRSLWIFFSGTVDYDWKYQMMFDMLSGRAILGNVRYQGFESGDLTIGKQRETFGLSRFSAGFAGEASPVSIRMAPLLNLGIAFNGHHNRFTYGFGIFQQREQDSALNFDGSEEFAFSARGTWDPIREPGNLLHLGTSVSVRNFGGGPFQIKSRMGVHTIDDFFPAQSASFNADQGNYLGLEFARIIGPWTLSSELIHMQIDELNSPRTYDLTGYYLLAGLFLGDHTERYGRKKGRFKRFKPPAGETAWQLIVRYDDLDLNDEGSGTKNKGITIGLTWYANRAVRVMSNYTWIDVSGDDAEVIVGDHTTGDTASMRIQYFF